MKKSAKLARVLFIALAATAVFTPSFFRIFENFELATLDLRFKTRPAQPQNGDIAIIEIANDTLEKIGRWPFRRSWHAALIDILSASGARMVVFDALFSEESEDDAMLIESTRNAGNVYYGFSFDLTTKKLRDGVIEVERIDTPLLPGLIRSSRGQGYINVIPDRDGTTRRAALRIRYNGRMYPHLALLVAADYLGKDTAAIESPSDEESLTLINYAAKWQETFEHFSYVDIIKSYSLLTKGETGAVDLTRLEDKVCFIGLTATGTHDLNPNPMEERYPGLGIHINVFNMITTGNFLKRAGRFTNLFILLILVAVTAFVTLRTRPLVSSIFMAVLFTALCLAAWAIFAFGNLWIDVFYPVIALFIIYLAMTFYKYISERQKRELIEKELEVASKIQLSFLPQKPPEAQGIEIFADMSPAKQVGGDLYDFVELGGGKTGVMVGDVSGKGVPAALYMARAVSLFRLFSKTTGSTKEAVTKLNDALSDESASNLFVTLTYLICDMNEGSLTC
jgi:CHASE2 domain-containing sensor protein